MYNKNKTESQRGFSSSDRSDLASNASRLAPLPDPPRRDTVHPVRVARFDANCCWNMPEFDQLIRPLVGLRLLVENSPPADYGRVVCLLGFEPRDFELHTGVTAMDFFCARRCS